MDTQTFKVGDEVVTDKYAGLKLFIVTLEVIEWAVGHKDTVVTLRGENGFDWGELPIELIHPYFGSQVWWQREGRALYADAQAKLAAVEAAKAAIRQEIQKTKSSDMTIMVGFAMGLQKALDLLEGK